MEDLNQFGGYLSEKIGKTVHKVIFQTPSDAESGKMVEICQRYFNPKDSKMRVHGHEFPVNVKDWVRQRGNKFIQYKDWNTVTNYSQFVAKSIDKSEKVLDGAGKIDFYEIKTYLKPNGDKLLSKELGVNKVAEVVEGATKGAKMDVGIILVVAVAMAALMGGALLGYLGFPAIMGQHLVANPQPVVKLVMLLVH